MYSASSSRRTETLRLKWIYSCLVEHVSYSKVPLGKRQHRRHSRPRHQESTSIILDSQVRYCQHLSIKEAVHYAQDLS